MTFMRFLSVKILCLHIEQLSSASKMFSTLLIILGFISGLQQVSGASNEIRLRQLTDACLIPEFMSVEWNETDGSSLNLIINTVPAVPKFMERCPLTADAQLAQLSLVEASTDCVLDSTSHRLISCGHTRMPRLQDCVVDYDVTIFRKLLSRQGVCQGVLHSETSLTTSLLSKSSDTRLGELEQLFNSLGHQEEPIIDGLWPVIFIKSGAQTTSLSVGFVPVASDWISPGGFSEGTGEMLGWTAIVFNSIVGRARQQAQSASNPFLGLEIYHWASQSVSGIDRPACERFTNLSPMVGNFSELMSPATVSESFALIAQCDIEQT